MEKHERQDYPEVSPSSGRVEQSPDGPGAVQTPPAGKKEKSEALEWLKAIAIAVVLVLLIRWLFFAPFIVDGPSMQPNFHTGERIIVNKICC